MWGVGGSEKVKPPCLKLKHSLSARLACALSAHSSLLCPCPFHAGPGLVLLMLWCLLRKLTQGLQESSMNFLVLLSSMGPWG